jgi:predicted HTH domain antitoxin
MSTSNRSPPTLAVCNQLPPAMQPLRSVASGELSPKARELLDAVRRGETIIFETEGEEEAVLIGAINYRILRAVMHALTSRPDVEPKESLPKRKLMGEPRSQERFNQVIAHYLAEGISLSRASELLEMAPSRLRARFDRLEIPRRVAPLGREETRHDVQTALNWPDAAS